MKHGKALDYVNVFAKGFGLGLLPLVPIFYVEGLVVAPLPFRVLGVIQLAALLGYAVTDFILDQRKMREFSRQYAERRDEPKPEPHPAAAPMSPTLMTLNSGRSLPVFASLCVKCDSEWFTQGWSSDWLSSFCPYCGAKFTKTEINDTQNPVQRLPGYRCSSEDN